MVNKFYKLTDGNDKTEFDLRDLGEFHNQVASGAIISKKGEIHHFGGGRVRTTEYHYDNEFVSLLYRINPVYRISNCLDYHFANYISTNDGANFLKHIKYVILPSFKNRIDITELITEWYNKNNSIMIRKHLEEKNDYLLEVYQAAVNAELGNVMSIRVLPYAVGEVLGFDKQTVERIVYECVAERLLASPLGMPYISITQAGLGYLQTLNKREAQSMNGLNINVGNNSNVQIQNGSHHSHQELNNEILDDNAILQLINDLNANVDKLMGYLKEDEIETIKDSAGYLEKNFSKRSKVSTIFNAMLKGIGETLKAVPAKIIANVLTNPSILTSIGS